MEAQHKKSLFKRGILMFALVPVVLAAWAVGGYINGWDIVWTAMNSAVCTMFLLAGFILSPLLMDYPPEERRRGYVFFWFAVSTIFNLIWQIPLILFRSSITQADITYANLFKYVGWWGYGFADAHYGKVSRWMMSEETWWFLAIVIASLGVLSIRRGREMRGYVLMGVGFLFQAYNASLYMVYDAMTGFQNIPSGHWQSWALYWGFNPLWAICAMLAGIFCVQVVLRAAENRRPSM